METTDTGKWQKGHLSVRVSCDGRRTNRPLGPPNLQQIVSHPPAAQAENPSGARAWIPSQRFTLRCVPVMICARKFRIGVCPSGFVRGQSMFRDLFVDFFALLSQLLDRRSRCHRCHRPCPRAPLSSGWRKRGMSSPLEMCCVISKQTRPSCPLKLRRREFWLKFWWENKY